MYVSRDKRGRFTKGVRTPREWMNWKIDDVSRDELAKLYSEVRSQKEIADVYGVCQGSVSNWMKKFGINASRKWTEREQHVLKENYNRVPNKEIAKLIGRTKKAVQQKARVLGLTREPRPEWTGEEKRYLRENYKKRTWGEIGKKLGRPLRGVRKVAMKSGLSRRGWNRLFFGSKEDLERLYWGEDKTAEEIGRLYNVSGRTITTWLKVFDIRRKSPYRNLFGGFPSEEAKKRTLKKSLKSRVKKPNKLEQRLVYLFEENRIPFRYCGDGDVIIGGKCPDFINYNGRKQVLELFGRAFHDPKHPLKARIPYHQTEEGTIEHYKRYGFDCFVIWDNELKTPDEVVERIKRWVDA